MCWLRDLRVISYVASGQGLLIGYDCEVDEDGQACSLTGAQTLGFIPSELEGVRSAQAQLAGYWCNACGQDFSSWEEAKLHPEDADTEPRGDSRSKIKN
jgi:hypothetical protein